MGLRIAYLVAGLVMMGLLAWGVYEVLGLLEPATNALG